MLKLHRLLYVILFLDLFASAQITGNQALASYILGITKSQKWADAGLVAAFIAELVLGVWFFKTILARERQDEAREKISRDWGGPRGGLSLRDISSIN